MTAIKTATTNALSQLRQKTSTALLQPAGNITTQQPAVTQTEPVAAESTPRIKKRDILLSNMSSLNGQIDIINEIISFARDQKFSSDYFNEDADRLTDPSPYYNIAFFMDQANYVSTIAYKTRSELIRFDHPQIPSMQIKLRAVRLEVENIKRRVGSSVFANMPVNNDEESLQSNMHHLLVPSLEQRSYEQRARARKRAYNLQHSTKLKSIMKRQRPIYPSLKSAQSTKRKTGIIQCFRDQSPDRIDSHYKTAGSGGSLGSSDSNRAQTLMECSFCEEEHEHESCPIYSTHEEREMRRAELNLCYSCLRPYTAGHSRRCSKYGLKCKHCHGHASHKALCKWLHKNPRKMKRPPSFPSFRRADEDRRWMEYRDGEQSDD